MYHKHYRDLLFLTGAHTKVLIVGEGKGVVWAPRPPPNRALTLWPTTCEGSCTFRGIWYTYLHPFLNRLLKLIWKRDTIWRVAHHPMVEEVSSSFVYWSPQRRSLTGRPSPSAFKANAHVPRCGSPTRIALTRRWKASAPTLSCATIPAPSRCGGVSPAGSLYGFMTAWMRQYPSPGKTQGSSKTSERTSCWRSSTRRRGCSFRVSGDLLLPRSLRSAPGW